MSDAITVDIWSDVMCPWCAIGTTQYLKAVQELKGDVDVETRFMPFELDPETPPEGKKMKDHLARVYNKSPEEVAQMSEHVAAAGDNAGFSMRYAGEGEEPELTSWNTLEAHKLLRWALTQDSAESQLRLKMALFRAHFQQRKTISDREVLLDVAEAEGFDKDAAAAALDDEALTIAVKMEEKRALENGINSVPTLVVAGKYILQGSAEPEQFKQAITKIANMEAMA